jgi:D-alanyl-D-alanine dipeptidase
MLTRPIPLALVGVAACAATPKSGPTHPLAGARQVVVVTAAGWSAQTGTLTRWQREDANDPWHRVGDEVQVALGKGGMGWGRGLHPAQPRGPVKQEGDNRTPAGAFRLSGTFGYEPSAIGRLPYTPLTDDIQCVDDGRSKRYNVIVDRKGITNPDWKSFERMRRDDDLYRLGVVVEHNAFPATPGAGSCIFLHIWSGPAQPTVGCTAMAADGLAKLAEWLDPAARPVLVELPEAEYSRLHTSWQLP